MRPLFLLPLVLLIAAAPEPRWIPAWISPPIGYEPGIRDGLGRPFKDETVRQDLRVGVAGKSLRVRFTNELSDTPLRIGGASLLRLDAAGKPVPGSLVQLSFVGQGGTIVPARAPMLSDPIAFPVRAGERLAVSIHYPDEVAPPAHAQMVDIAVGNQTGALELTAPKRARASGLVSGIEVAGATQTRVIVTFGDSITEGAGATPGKGMSWPDQLASMLGADARGRCWAVANAGISGNRLLSSGRGPNALSRFDRDVLATSGITHVVLLEGINDIGKVRDPATQRQPAAAELIAAYEQLLARAHARGLKMIVGTLLPYEGAAYADAAGEARRQAVNAWIRANASRFDGFIDFDAAMQDPGKPSAMRASDHIGDYLHPNDAGYSRMARAALPVVLKERC
jgi:lysophospholipase L1-like esterase